MCNIKAEALSLDVLKLVVLCMEHMDISYDTGVSKVIESIINDKATSAAGIEDSVVSVFDTGVIEVGGGKGSCMKGGPIDRLVLALCPFVDYFVVD